MEQGGAVTITAGAGGVGSTSGAGGAVTISGGVGGVGTTTSGAGGAVTLQGGTAAAAVGAAGGAASLIGRAGSSTGSGGNGGAVTITAGAAGGDDSVSRSGGNIALIAGASKGNITGGGVTLTAGAASINPTVSGSVTGPQGGSMTLTVGAGGTAPNATTTSSGGAGGTFTLQGSAGGIASVSGSVNNTGGSGSTFNFNGGTGGAATGATNGTNTGGTGGGLAFTAGTGGAATTGSGTLLGGNGGTIFLIGGTGGTGTTGGAGGSITLQGGSAAASAGSAGGGITLTGRTGSSTGSGGAGGGININAGAAGGDDTVARAGGSVSISAGASKGNTAAGAITFNAGSGGQNLATGTASGPASGAFTITLATGGTAPNADVSSTGGAGGTFTIQNGTGGAASVAGTGNNTGGAGSSAAWTLGTGGAANGNTSGTNTGGSGGNFTLQAGTGGAASVGSGTLQGGVGGNISITAGTGGTGTAGGNGGSATLQGGGAAASAGSAGGGVNITGRTGSTTGTGGAGGGVTLTGGAAGGDNTVARAGGAITLTAGLSKGNQVGGGISLTTGAGGDNQTGVSVTGPSGGNFTLTLGSGGLASTATTAAVGGTAGTYTITGGAGGVAGVAGTGTNTGGVGSGFTWTAGAGGAASGATSGTNTGGAGGAITLTSGTGGAASAGSGTLQGGSGGLLTIGAGNGGAGNAGTGGTGANLVLQAGIGGSGTTAAGAGGVIRFLTGATTTLSERVRISNAGFVGIGTTNPSVMLDVAGDFKTGTAQTFSLSRTLPATIGATVELGTLTCNGNSANFTAYMSDSQAGGRYYEFLRNYDYPITGSNWEELLPTNTTGPRSNDTRLDVNIANQGTIILRLRNVVAVSATLGVVLKLEGGTCGFVSSSATATGATVTGLNATNIMTQYTGNKIGIGTATPSNLLHVVGTTNATGIQLQQTTTALTGTNNLLLVQSALADTTTGGLARFDQAGTGSTSAVVVINSASTSNAQTNANPSLSAGTASGLKVVTADDDAPSLLIRNTASSACVGQFTGCSGAVNAGGEGILTIEGNDNTNTTRYNLITAYNSNTRSAAAAVFRVRADGNVYGEAAFNATGADLAEYFETTDTSLEPGDVVVSDLNTEKVLKSKKQYADNLVGVISTAPAFVGNNPGGANDNKSNFKQVGLVGRLPIKVTTENGEIKPGDFLTSSKLFPGYAMKATRSGQIIGQALENFPIPELRGVSVVSEIESGKVLTFLKPGYQVINNTFTLEPEDGQLTSQLFKIETNNQDTALLVNQKGSGNLLTLQRDGTDSFIVKNNGSVYLSSNIQEVTLPVLNISNLDKKLFVVYANGNLEITGNIKVSKNSSGKAVLKLGDNRVKVKFTVPYPTTPNVFVTLTGLPPVTYSVIDKSPEGFTIVLAEPATSDRTFEWLAVEQPEATDSESILILDSVTPNADPQENNTPQSQVQNQIQDQEPSKPEAESEAKIPESIEAENNNSDILITE